MATPIEKKEYMSAVEWSRKSKNSKLQVIPCISGWMDICGFGSALETHKWDLVKLQKDGLLELLSAVYQIAGHPFLVNLEPIPFESVLIINDGISRTVDLHNLEYSNAHQFIYYLRDLFFAHNNLRKLTHSFGYGIRSVFAGGERVQFSPTFFTGNSVLYHDENNMSDYSKQLLKKNFLYNPAEFQMNTAFAKAYSIDSMGSNKGFKINGCYFEISFWNLISKIPNLDIEDKKTSKLIYLNGHPALEIFFIDTKIFSFKGLDMTINQIGSIRIDEHLEGEEVYFKII